jgi:hypothetical protein
MKEVKSAKELIDLAKKRQSHELKVTGAKVFYKRMTVPEAMVYFNSDKSDANLLFYTLCDSDGNKLFKDKDHANEFTDNIPVQDYQALINSVTRFNFPTIEEMAGNS